MTYVDSKEQQDAEGCNESRRVQVMFLSIFPFPLSVPQNRRPEKARIEADSFLWRAQFGAMDIFPQGMKWEGMRYTPTQRMENRSSNRPGYSETIWMSDAHLLLRRTGGC